MKNLNLNQIIDDISHDIQSKIMSIKAQVYLAKHHKGDLEKVESDLQQLSHLFDDLTTLLILHESGEKFDQSSLKIDDFISFMAGDFSLTIKIDKSVPSDFLIKANQDLVNWFLKIFKKYLLLCDYEKKVDILVQSNDQRVEINYHFEKSAKSTKTKLLNFYLFSLQSVAKFLKFRFEINADDSYSLIV